jgi:hypothetical protein
LPLKNNPLEKVIKLLHIETTAFHNLIAHHMEYFGQGPMDTLKFVQFLIIGNLYANKQKIEELTQKAQSI